MLLPRIHSRRAAGGFTLVEALVAVGLTTILLWGLLQLFTLATRFSSAVTTEAELTAAGRAVLERVTREVGSATSREVGHQIRIIDGGEFDEIRFHAPVADDGATVAEIRYYAKPVGTKRVLTRRDLSRPLAEQEASFGVNVERFNILYVYKNISGDIELEDGSRLFASTDTPMAIAFEIRLRDRKGMATITLCSSAFLPTGGL